MRLLEQLLCIKTNNSATRPRLQKKKLDKHSDCPWNQRTWGFCFFFFLSSSNLSIQQVFFTTCEKENCIKYPTDMPTCCLFVTCQRQCLLGPVMSLGASSHLCCSHSTSNRSFYILLGSTGFLEVDWD